MIKPVFYVEEFFLGNFVNRDFVMQIKNDVSIMLNKCFCSLEENLGKSPGASHLQDLEQTFSSYKVSSY
jgi:hypothetical protein